VLRKTAPDYDPQNRGLAFAYIKDRIREGEFLTGLLYVDKAGRDMHELSNTVGTPLRDLTWESLCPGEKVLPEILSRYR